MLNKSNKTTKIAQKLGIFFVSFGLALSLSLSAYAASLTLEEKRVPTEISDFSVLVTLAVSDADDVASLDFTLTYDTEKMILNSITPALHLQASGKILETNEDVIGTVKGIIYGLNQTEIAPGDLFQLNFSKVNGAEDGVVDMSFSDVHASSITAASVNLATVNNTVVFEIDAQSASVAPDVPAITNTTVLLDQNHLTLQWTDESASGATNYVLTRMQKPVSPLAISNGLVSYWPMNEESGDALDLVGSNSLRDSNQVFHALQKPFDTIPGSRDFWKQNKASFIASNEESSGLINHSQMTWSAWIKPRTLDSTMSIVDQWNIPDQVQKYFNLSITNTGALQGSISSNGKNQSVCTSVADAIKVGVWQHIAMVMNINNGTSKPFADVTQRNTVTPFGSVAIDSADSMVCPSAALNSTKSGFAVPANTNLAFSSGAFTVDFWVKLDALSNDSYTYLISQYKTSNQYMDLGYSNKDKYLLFRWKNAADNFGANITAANISLSQGQWHHIAIVRAGSGNSYSLFVNGEKKAIKYNKTSKLCTYINAPLYIGCFRDGSYGFKGNLDEIRITKGVARWNANFDPTQVDTRFQSKNILFLPFNEDTTVKLYVDGKDVSTALIENAATPLGTVSDQLRIGSRAGGSNYFDGLIADVACWEQMLNADEISSMSFSEEKTFVVASTSKEDSNIPDGEYFYTVQSSNTDAISDYSEAYKVEIDTTPPVMPTITTTASQFNSRSIVISGKCSLDTNLLEIFSNTVSVGNLVFGGGEWSAALSVEEDGAYQISVIASDEAGNLAQPVIESFTVDTVIPAVAFVSPAAEYTVPRKNVVFQGSVTDATAVAGHFRFTTPTSNGQFDVNIENNNFQFTYTLTKGLNQCWFTVTDAAGNQKVKTFNVTYANDLPLEFTGLQHHAITLDEVLTFMVSITHQNDIDPELLTFSASNLPGQGSANPATFDPKTRVFKWTPSDDQEGLYSVTFMVNDGIQSVSKTIKIVARNYNFDVLDLEAIIAMPQDHQVVIMDFNKDGYQDIFEVMHGSNKLYMNRSDETFVNVAESAGVADADGLGNAAIGADFNKDGWIDLYVVNEADDKLFINNQDGTFSDETVAYGVGDPGKGRDVAVADFDNDNDLDIYILNDGENTYYENDGVNHFTDKTDSAFLGCPGIGMNMCVFDSNKDGLLDIFIVNDGADAFFMNSGDGEFIDATANIGGNTDTIGYRGMLRDFDNDGNIDVYLLNSRKNIIYQNDGQGVFKAVEIVKVENTAAHSKSSYYIDYDNDNNLDLFIVDQSAKFVDGFGNILFHNDGDGQFTDMTAIAELL